MKLWKISAFINCLNLSLIILVLINSIINFIVFSKNVIQIVDNWIILQICISKTLVLCFQKVSFFFVTHFIFIYLILNLFIFFLAYMISNFIAYIIFIYTFLNLILFYQFIFLCLRKIFILLLVLNFFFKSCLIIRV